jgi:hypothetical protein
MCLEENIMMSLPLGRPGMDLPILEVVVFDEAIMGRLVQAHDHQPADLNASRPLECSYPVVGDPSPRVPSRDAMSACDNMFMNTSRGSHIEGMYQGPFPLAPFPLSRLSQPHWHR